MTSPFRDALRQQATTCKALGSDFTARLFDLLADRLTPGNALTDRLFDWPGRVDASGASVPLRLAGTLHGLVLDGVDADLAAVYPPNSAGDDAIWAAVSQGLTRHSARISAWLDHPPQTNEVGRSAVLIAVGHWLTDQLAHPLVLSELGASAGLNLMWDRFALDLGDALVRGPAEPALTLRPAWTGEAPADAIPRVSQRRGVDLHPLDPHDPADALRLLAYIWPDQAERLARSRAAMAVAEAPVDAGDAADWLRTQLAAPFLGACHLIYHTVAWQYFPPAVQAEATRLIEAAGARATADAPLAWFGMEADEAGRGAGMHLRLWPGDLGFAMGRVDFHGRWVDWAPRQTS